MLWKPNQISKRIFATSKPTFIPKATPVFVEKKVPTVGGSAIEANKRNATDWAIIRQLMKYIWPKNDIGVKSRVVIALSLLVGGKVSK
jgi:ABC transporter ATM